MTKNVSWGLIAALCVGCGSSEPQATDKPGQSPPKAKSSTDAKYVLDAEPANSKGVIETRKNSKNGEPVVVVGRIAGSATPFVEGRASFSIADLTIEPCADSEGCPTPWDCCCTPSEELLPAMAQVKFVDAAGKTVAKNAKELLGVKEMNVVVVKGKADRDAAGNLTVVAEGLFVQKAK